MSHKNWICEICGFEYDSEVDLLAHQFNSNCESDLADRYKASEQGSEDNKPIPEANNAQDKIDALSKQLSENYEKLRTLRS